MADIDTSSGGGHGKHKGGVRSKKLSTRVDLTPMVDLAFLLVTFFILTASFRSPEPVQVITPSSTSDKLMPENSVLITISDSGKVFYNVSGADVRVKVLQRMAAKYKIKFTEKEAEEFSGMASFGVSMQNLSKFINCEPGKRENDHDSKVTACRHSD